MRHSDLHHNEFSAVSNRRYDVTDEDVDLEAFDLLVVSVLPKRITCFRAGRYCDEWQDGPAESIDAFAEQWRRMTARQ